MAIVGEAKAWIRIHDRAMKNRGVNKKQSVLRALKKQDVLKKPPELKRMCRHITSADIDIVNGRASLLGPRRADCCSPHAAGRTVAVRAFRDSCDSFFVSG